ncbi:MAG: TSUP family transporter, partial [Deltaproteobacteria bacterium]|nr:TSUP family transporter [Deltaproteobacteria bacterium]
GTLLMPVFALFFPVELAVAATAVVHGANNVLKASLLGRMADWKVVAKFGIPAVIAALLGAWVLGLLSGTEPLARYAVLGRGASVTPLKLLMAALMTGFAALELHPRFEKLQFDRRYLPAGGLLSGFFGGLSGHQGALRSAFLAKVGISPEAFVGTNAIIGLFVDLTRLSVYAALFLGTRLTSMAGPRERWLIAAGALAALAGVLIGKRLLKKVTMKLVQRLTGVMLLLIAALLGAGVI